MKKRAAQMAAAEGHCRIERQMAGVFIGISAREECRALSKREQLPRASDTGLNLVDITACLTCPTCGTTDREALH